MTDEIFASEGNVFVQSDPASAFSFLTCTEVGDITIPKAGRTLTYKPDSRRSGKFVASGAIDGVAGLVTATLTKPLSSVLNYLTELTCDFQARINWTCRGDRTNISNYQVAAVLFGSRLTSSGISRPVVTSADNNARVNTTGELGAMAFTYIYPLTGTRQTLTSTTHAYCIAFLPEECASACGDRLAIATKGWAGLESTAYTVSYLIKTLNGGASWAAPADVAGIFGAPGDVSDIILMETASSYRILVSRGSAEAGDPAEVSYSDSAGAAWSNSNVGATNGMTIQAMARDILGHVWAVCSGGYIYRSDDQGVTWTAYESGVETVQDLNDIVMYSELKGYAVGNSNAFLRTTDGTTWESVTGPIGGQNLLTVAVNAAGHVFVGAANGIMYRSVDSGVTWTTLKNIGTGSVKKIRFDPDMLYVGYALFNTGAPVGTLYRSEDGGNTWTALTTPTNAGLNNMFICDPNTVFICGNAQGGTTFIAKYSRSS